MSDIETPAPRKRGRPRKDGAQVPVPKPVVLDHNGEPRKRGRPRKNPVVEPGKASETTTATNATVTEPKKRGRPRKMPAVVAVGEPASAIENATTLSTEPDMAESKKRGSHRKVSVQEATGKEAENAAAEPTKKRRGRPPKVPAAEGLAIFSTETTATEIPKKRGRPSKVSAQEAEKQSESTTAEPKKRRGRPPKTPAAENPATASTDTVVAELPKKRGRPRKSVVDATVKSETNAETVTKRDRGRPRKSDAPAATPKSTKTEKKTNEKTTKQSAGLRMEDIVGNYAIQCETVDEEWPDVAEDMNLNIVKEADGFMAEFDLGILEGVMLLAPDKASLDEFVALKSDEADVSSEDEHDSEEGNEPPPKKKAKSSTSSPTLKSRRVVFKWRGRETSEGQIHADMYPNDQEGYLEFADNKADNFVGFAGFPAMGQNCKFTGTRNGESSGPTARWSDYSPKAAEEANKNRWG